MAAAMTCTTAGLQQNSTGVSSQSAQQHQAGNSTSQARSIDAKGNLLPQMPLPCPGMPPFLMPPFGRMPFPMLPMMPGMMSPMGNSKGLPPVPVMFPHPAQLQAMSQAAQAAMAQAAKQPGSMPPFPMGMMSPMHMMMQPVPPCMQSTASAPGQVAGQAAAADDDDDDDDADEDRLDVDDNVEVEPELEQLFEKVAAMERAKQQEQQRASSPCTSIHSAATGQALSHPCSPTAGTGFTQPAAAPVAASSGIEAAPVPWLSFAADDKVDNLDDDLAQIITLPDLPGSSSGSPVGCSSPVAAVAGKPNMHLKRVSSTGSAYSSGDALTGAAATPLATNANPAATSKSSKPKVLRIRSIKGCGSAAGSASKTPASSKSGSKAPAAPANKAGPKSSSAQKPAGTAAAAGLGAGKAGVQKKASSGGNSSKAKGSKAATQSTSPAPVQKTQQQQQQQTVASPAKQQPAAAADELDLLGDLAELESGFSDTCFGSSGDDMGIDSFDFMGELLQESSEDAWDGLLGMTAADMEL